MSKAWSSFALLGSTATLVCCVIPALMVALGFGATFASLVSAIPQLTILSEYKKTVFLISGSLLALATWIRFRPAAQTCPTDPQLAKACEQTRRFSKAMLTIAFLLYLCSLVFVYVIPLVLE